jgi:hypothetical protein
VKQLQPSGPIRFNLRAIVGEVIYVKDRLWTNARREHKNAAKPWVWGNLGKEIIIVNFIPAVDSNDVVDSVAILYLICALSCYHPPSFFRFFRSGSDISSLLENSLVGSGIISF